MACWGSFRGIGSTWNAERSALTAFYALRSEGAFRRKAGSIATDRVLKDCSNTDVIFSDLAGVCRWTLEDTCGDESWAVSIVSGCWWRWNVQYRELERRYLAGIENLIGSDVSVDLRRSARDALLNSGDVFPGLGGTKDSIEWEQESVEIICRQPLLGRVVVLPQMRG